MNKIAQYLNGHILGEIVTDNAIRDRFARDGSVLSLKPDVIIHPRNTNDVRKIARFTWQLAEKGHVIPITVRGGGSDRTGAAIGKGIIINMMAHLNKVIFINPKSRDQFVHLQTGMNISNLNSILHSKGLDLPIVPSSADYCTMGGVLANNANGLESGKNGAIGSWVNRLEVVLANGDLIETARISKHELSKKKGLQTFEGEIYRKIDGLIDDNQQLIADQIDGYDDNLGYNGISKVKRRDGSFDLTPLIIGSQGTLGIISEAAIRTTLYNENKSIVVATFKNAENARDTADNIAKNAKPASLELFEGKLFDIARTYGKKYIFPTEETDQVSSVLYIIFDDINARNQKHAMRQTIKLLSQTNATIYTEQDYPTEELEAVRNVGSFISQSVAKDKSVPQILSGSAIATERREEFIDAIRELEHKHLVELPMQIQWISGIVKLYPTLDLHLVSDKQKALKLIKDYLNIVIRLEGTVAAESGEGRLKTMGAYEQIDTGVLDLYVKIRQVFDPYGTLNPGVKQKANIKSLAASLDKDYSLADFSQFSPRE